MHTRTTVLIIEDVLLQLDMYELALQDIGYDVLRATRGHTGYDVAATEKPDVIILDLMLPDVDGWVVCAWLKANPVTAAIPVIVLTARDDYDIPLRAMHANVAALFHKPCSIDRLAAAIDKALGRPRGASREEPPA
jgi:DNA-binding response OmpR family regulator